MLAILKTVIYYGLSHLMTFKGEYDDTDMH